MLDKRSNQLLQLLLQSHQYVSIKELMDKFRVSRRSVYYDIEEINYWLKQIGLREVQYMYAKGFYLDETSKQRIRQEWKRAEPDALVLRSDERQMYLLLFLLGSSERITTTECIRRTGLSRNTILMDIKQLREEIQLYGLKLPYSRVEGYTIDGHELNIRKLLSQYIPALLHNGHEPLLNGLFLHRGDGRSIPELIRQWLAVCEQSLELQFAEDYGNQLRYLLAFFVKRILEGRLVSFLPEQTGPITATKQYEMVAELERELHIELPQDEKCYMAMMLLSAKVNKIDVPTEQNDMLFLKQAIHKMIQLFEVYACVVFDQPEELERNLFIHLKPAYYRFIYNIELANPLTEMIQEQYRDIYELTKKSIAPLEEVVGKPIRDAEISYLTLHFGGWMRKQGIMPITQKRVLLVCANGVGTSRLLVQQLEGLFTNIDLLGPITLREYEQFHGEVEIVISTAKIINPRHRIILVQPILTDQDRVHLLNEIETMPRASYTNTTAQTIVNIVKKHARIEDEVLLLEEIRQALQQSKHSLGRGYKPVLKELLTDEYIQLQDEVTNWQEAIRLAALPLVKNHLVTETYIEAMIHNVQENGPYVVIAPRIALPHARPEQGVNRVGMGFLRLKKPVAFSDQPQHQAQLIIVLAAVDNETHLKALSQLSMMLSEDDNADRLIEADDKEVIKQYIAKYSNQQGE
ncbi:BglG family transcription antiterminator [Brevibacillus ginsengisoli]|uniref:BglG family transcription antiterminator n=1 Tax=Brevibacillus ginsengisoli TaxID=363854 RepID=UPI003CE9B5B9